MYVQHPEFRAPQTSDTKGRLAVPGELSRRRDLIDAAEAMYAGILADALPQKTERARAITLAGRLESLSSRNSTAAALSSRDRLREDVAATFHQLPTERQMTLLEYQWRTIASPALLPHLRRLVGSSPSPPLADLALRRL